MNFTIWAKGICIGSSLLNGSDLSMGMVHGIFVPTPQYESVRKTFLLFIEGKHEEYFVSRDELFLELKDGESVSLPSDFIHIEDMLDEYGEATIEVRLASQPAE